MPRRRRGWSGPLDKAIDSPAPARADRALISASIILATVMPAIDTTIANVALPRMGGSMSASVDQITWVLTSYIVGVVIMTPISGWLAQRFGRKRIFLISVVGFTIASGLCGAATSLGEMIVFRALQGALGAPMAPLSQAVLLDTYDYEERGPILALWSMSLMVAPILGPVLGGHITETLNWRWVFYINVPIGIIATLGVAAFIPNERRDPTSRLDVVGWAMLSAFVVALQLMLDRGQSAGWFESPEIITYAVLLAIALYLFVIHILTAEQPFLPLALLRDRNLVMTTLVNMAVGLALYSSMALLPPLLQTFMGYPVEMAGWVLAPRGVGALISSFIAGRLVGRFDDRLMIAFGLCTFAVSFLQMSGMSPDMDSRLIVVTGLIQGLGSGFIFIPLTTLGFATIAPHLRSQATGFATLLRNLGTSLGISIMVTLYTRDAQIAHARMAEAASPDNPLMRSSPITPWYDLGDPAGLAALNGEITRQASLAAYASVFHLLFMLSLALTPLVLLLQKPKRISA